MKKKCYFLDLEHKKGTFDNRKKEVIKPPELILYLQTKGVDRTVERVNIIEDVRKRYNWEKITEQRFERLKDEYNSYPYFEINGDSLIHLKSGHTIQTSFFDGEITPIKKKKFVKLVHEDAMLDEDHIPIEPARLFLVFEDGQRINIINYVRVVNGMLRISQKLKLEIRERIKQMGGEMEVTDEGFIKDLIKFIKVR